MKNIKKIFIPFLAIVLFFNITALAAQEDSEDLKYKQKISDVYTVGIDDVLKINIFHPETISTTVTISPDGYFFFPYIGSIEAKGKTLLEIQKDVTRALAQGYMKYPVVSVTLEASRSRKFYVFGEVMRPGMYLLEDKTDVIKAISMAGGFTKYGSTNKIKLLRPNDKQGFEQIKINFDAIINGSIEENHMLQTGDILFISEGMF